jgi:hypothetical protein
MFNLGVILQATQAERDASMARLMASRRIAASKVMANYSKVTALPVIEGVGFYAYTRKQKRG